MRSAEWVNSGGDILTYGNKSICRAWKETTGVRGRGEIHLSAVRGFPDGGRDLFDPAATDDIAVGEGGGLEFAGVGLRVHFREPESGVVAIVPFVVVE